MPQKTRTITAGGYSASSLLALAYGTCEKLGWNIKYAGENILVAYTPRSGFRWDMEITIQTTDDQLTVTSKMIHNESFDMMGRNRKNINEFMSNFESVRGSSTDPSIQSWNQKIEILKLDTIKAAEEEIKQTAEVDKVMNLSSGNLYATYAIIGINALVFVAMVATGVNFFAPAPIDVLKWGGNLSVLTLSGDWWRLFTSMFLHFGILHVGLNMYALFAAGVYLEPMLGKLRYISAYICTGLFASLVSTIWLKDKFTIAAGASGAVFGMYGVFLAFLTTNIIPKQLRNAMLQSTLIFVAYNVFYGLKPGSGIDNSAHLGGLISGFVIGYIYYYGIKNSERIKPALLTAIIIVATIAVIYFGVNNNKTSPTRIDYQTGKIYTSDEGLYNEQLMKFGELELKAMEPEGDTTISEEIRLERLEKISVPVWQDAKRFVEQIDTSSFSKQERIKTAILKEYVDLRISLTNLQIKAKRENTNAYNEQINGLIDKINTAVQKLGDKESPN